MADAPKKPLGIASMLLTVLLAVALFVVLRWIFSWIWRVIFFMGCVALAYVILHALGVIGDERKS